MIKKERLCLLLLILALFLVSGINGCPQVSKCYDSDGLDYYAKGYISYGEHSQEDICIDDNILREFSCKNNKMSMETFSCLYGCEDGACLKELEKGEPGEKLECIGEGKRGNMFDEEECCESLKQIAYCKLVGEQLLGTEEGSFVCSNCGNGLCEEGENYCNCVEDCPKDCLKEGEVGYGYIPKDECCEGLTPISRGFLMDGECAIITDASFVCTKCGDGICDEEVGENECTCEEDCKEQISEEFVEDEGILKPILMNLVASEDISVYLSDEVMGAERVWSDWKNYSPLVQKVNELTAGKTELEKIKAITSWVRKSKNYECPNLYSDLTKGCRSAANRDADFSEIFDSPTGVCLDAAIITTAMLRTAGIPGIPMMVQNFHVVTLYYYNGLWYNTDTTFCIDKSTCIDPKLLSEEETKKRIYFFYDRRGHLRREDGQYCDISGFCIKHPFISSKIMPLNDKSSEAEVIYPAFRNTYIGGIEGVQVFCNLEIKGLNCMGCQFSGINGEKWSTIQVMHYEIEDLRNIGYMKAKLPSSATYEKEEIIDGDEIITYEYKQVPYRYVCSQSWPEKKIFASKEFTLTSGQTLKITANDLINAGGISAEEFNELISKIKETEDF